MPQATRLGLRSVTYALEGRDILSNYGIPSTVVRLRPSESREGCAFGLELSRSDAQKAQAILNKADIEATLLNR